MQDTRISAQFEWSRFLVFYSGTKLELCWRRKLRKRVWSTRSGIELETWRVGPRLCEALRLRRGGGGSRDMRWNSACRCCTARNQIQEPQSWYLLYRDSGSARARFALGHRTGESCCGVNLIPNVWNDNAAGSVLSAT